MDGIVAKGDRMGRKIGYPTINLAPENELFPADGVYLTRDRIRSFERRVRLRDEHRPAADGLRGLRDDDRDLHPRLLANVYGERVRLFFLERLREERKFPSVMALTEQIGRDIEATRKHFATASPAGPVDR